MHVSVVIPVYESGVLSELTAQIADVFAERPQDTFEVVFVDDGSPSETVWRELTELAERWPTVRCVQLTRNFGQQAATLCGLAESRGEVVVTMDDDLQHDPEDISRLLAHADHDIVIGQLRRSRHALPRRLASRVKGVFDRLLIGKPRWIQLTSFRLLRRPVVDGVLAICAPRPFLPALLFQVSRDVVGVEVGHRPRSRGQSGYDLRRLVRTFNDLVIGNSSLLLRLIGAAGVLSSLLSLFLAAFVAIRVIVRGVAVPGWASLMVVLLLIGGLLLLGLGVIGEYLVRLLAAAEDRPMFIVRRRLPPAGDAAAR